MARIVNVYDAKTNLSKLLRAVERGDEIIIARAGDPVARLIAVRPARREVGFERGQILIAPNFDEFDEELERDFYG